MSKGRVFGGIFLGRDGSEYSQLEIVEIEAFSQMIALVMRDGISEKSNLEVEKRLQAMQKFESFGQLASGVVHDYNNLLTIILGNCSALIKKIRPEDPSRKHVEIIFGAGERAVNLSQKLLTYSRIQGLEPRAVCVNELVCNFRIILEQLLQSNISIDYFLSEEIEPIMIDSGQVEQILLNLVANARDAIGKSQGRIQVRTKIIESDEGYIDKHQTMSKGRFVTLAVEDNGCGILPEIIHEIFDDFFTTKELEKGTGLGLSTINGIVNQSGGTIHVESKVDKGTKFTIYFPSAYSG